MILFKLDSSYNPSDTIQNFDTLAWTERYQVPGDFQIVVNDEISVLEKLPLGSLISHTDTTEVMIVENHNIVRDKEKNLKIKITGRSFETFAENRTNVPVGNITIASIESPQAASYFATALLKLGLLNGFSSAADTIPNLLVYSDIRALDSAMESSTKIGDIYSLVLEYLRLCDGGIKTVRPNGAQTTMDLIVHDGKDLTLSIIFYAQYEDLEDAEYFWSIKTYKNYAAMKLYDLARIYRTRALLADVTGLERRLLYVDAGDLVNSTPPASDDYVAARAQIALNEHKKIALLQAKISNTAKPKFKINYDVGDLVTVFGEFATSQAMRVTEHILTVDKDGMRGYPSLSAI